jgi:hypothetical protein
MGGWGQCPTRPNHRYLGNGSQFVLMYCG